MSEELSREDEAIKNCKDHFRELFGEDIKIERLLSTVYKLLNEKWDEFATARLRHLNVLELEGILTKLNIQTLEADALFDPPQIQKGSLLKVVKKDNAKESKDIR